jgi:hypothetical protein
MTLTSNSSVTPIESAGANDRSVFSGTARGSRRTINSFQRKIGGAEPGAGLL